CTQLSPTLFPYTTLFRSGVGLRKEHSFFGDPVHLGRVASGRGEFIRAEIGITLVVRDDENNVRGISFPRRESVLTKGSARGASPDRKSTRLNSSHVKTSY